MIRCAVGRILLDTPHCTFTIKYRIPLKGEIMSDIQDINYVMSIFSSASDRVSVAMSEAISRELNPHARVSEYWSDRICGVIKQSIVSSMHAGVSDVIGVDVTASHDVESNLHKSLRYAKYADLNLNDAVNKSDSLNVPSDVRNAINKIIDTFNCADESRIVETNFALYFDVIGKWVASELLKEVHGD